MGKILIIIILLCGCSVQNMYMATSDKYGPGQRGGSKSELGIFETEEKAKTWIKQRGVRGQTYWQLVTIRVNTSKLKPISRGVMNDGRDSVIMLYGEE